MRFLPSRAALLSGLGVGIGLLLLCLLASVRGGAVFLLSVTGCRAEGSDAASGARIEHGATEGESEP